MNPAVVPDGNHQRVNGHAPREGSQKERRPPAQTSAACVSGSVHMPGSSCARLGAAQLARTQAYPSKGCRRQLRERYGLSAGLEQNPASS